VYELGDSSGLVLTVGKYLTPARTDIDREGLRPDFRHMPSADAAAQHLAACRAPPPAWR
jgi:C-terminal processing protease CtpA/Prc